MSDDTPIEPSTNGDNGKGRLPDGRFAKGNPGGPGSPYVRQLAAWRKAMAEAVTPEDIGAVVKALVEKAKTGEAWAVRELLDRTLGKATQPVDVDPEEPPPPVELTTGSDATAVLIRELLAAYRERGPRLPLLGPTLLGEDVPQREAPGSTI